MARKKVRLRYIADAAARKASLKKRRQGLLKKVQELSILCDVQACAIVYSEDKIERPVHWPEDRGEVDMVLQRFQACPEMERWKKMVTKDDYVRQRTEKYKEQAERLQSSIHEMEMFHLMQLIHIDGRSHGEFTTSELRRLNPFLSEKVRELERKADVLIQAGNAPPPPSPPPHPAGGVQPPNPLAAPSTPAGNFQGFVEMLRRRTPISGSSLPEQVMLPYPHQSEGTISRFPAGNFEVSDVSGMTNDQDGDRDAFFGHNPSSALGAIFPCTTGNVGGYAANPYEWSNIDGPGWNMKPVEAIGEECLNVGPYMGQTQPGPGLNTEHGGIGDVVRGYFNVSKYMGPTHGYASGIPSLQNPMLGRNIHGGSGDNVQAPPENIPGVVAVSIAPASLTSFVNENNPRSGGF